MKIPADFPVRPLNRAQAAKNPNACTCGACGRSWDDSIATSWTPTPSGRCPFEYYHADASAPRKIKPEGANRRPVMTADALAGLARLADLVPYSVASESRDVRAALDYVRRLVAFEHSPRRAAMLAATLESVRATRPLKGGAAGMRRVDRKGGAT
jgi:hypothetical protein